MMRKFTVPEFNEIIGRIDFMSSFVHQNLELSNYLKCNCILVLCVSYSGILITVWMTSMQEEELPTRHANLSCPGLEDQNVVLAMVVLPAEIE